LLQPVGVGHKTLADYTHLVGRDLIEEIRQQAEDLKGLKVLHLSATAFGGGVSEILYTLVPLMRDVGIEAEWQVIIGREEFFNATKLMHNALQGHPLDLSPSEWRVYEDYNEMNAQQLSEGWDVVIVHDPQPLLMRRHVPEKSKAWIWRCHIDLSTPHPRSRATTARSSTSRSTCPRT
jgi:trehalose synthase